MALTTRETDIIRAALAFHDVREELEDLILQSPSPQRAARLGELEIKKAQLLSLVQWLGNQPDLPEFETHH